ncbi:sulfotransferase family protein [Virgibacillus ihumii]|uniref:sulfotransferase family protein n=1 Tax=Virgibacillus ihumii TaxID=2686091 RepID=UPI00157D4569|nr:sulfotransferase [Virgibacillus ihumii]
MKKPNFFIAGISKSGTTSLHNYLDMHPDIFMSKFKEPQFFINEILEFPHNGPGDRTEEDIVNTEEEYENLFKGVTDEKIIGESSSDYLYYEESASKIKAYSNDAKIVLMLRNPVDRAYSAYTHLTRDGRETKSFEYALNMEEERIRNNYGCMWHLKAMSLYYKKVKHFIDEFGKDNVKVIIFEEFKNNSSKVLNEICDFLNIERFNYDEVKLVNYNTSGVPKNKKLLSLLQQGFLKRLIKVLVPKIESREKIKKMLYSRILKRESMSESTRMELINYFKNDVRKLEEFLDVDLAHWLN